MIKKSAVVVLLSGGLDSMVLTHYFLSKKNEVVGLFVDYGQEWHKETESAEKLAKHFNIPIVQRLVADTHISQIHINPLGLDSHGFVPMRNAFLLCLAIAEAYKLHLPYVAIGSNRSEFPDQSSEFIDRFNFMVDYCFKAERPWVLAPFCNWSKERIYKYALKHDLPIELTWSCNIDTEFTSTPCGVCQACKMKEKYG